MFNSEAKDAAVTRFECSIKQHNDATQQTTRAATELHRLRTETAEQIIGEAEKYFSELANAPKEFEYAINEYRVAYEYAYGAPR